MNKYRFESVKVNGASLPERTAEQISRLIMERRLVGGDRLPSEFELAEMLNVGRGTIREGIKLLAARNILEIHRGKGTYVTSNPGEIPDPLGLAYYPDQHRLAVDLAEIRSQIEPWVARTAAERLDADDVKKLCEICSTMEQDILAEEDYSESDVQFHMAIAECTRNPIIPKLLHMIYTTPSVSLKTYRSKMKIIVDHKRILDAICSRDGGGAAQAMAQHIENSKILMNEIDGETAQ